MIRVKSPDRLAGIAWPAAESLSDVLHGKLIAVHSGVS
jgi:hypothetical protein